MILALVRTKKGFHSRTAAKGCCTGSRRSLAKNGAVVAALQAVLGMGRKSGHKMRHQGSFMACEAAAGTACCPAGATAAVACAPPTAAGL